MSGNEAVWDEFARLLKADLEDQGPRKVELVLFPRDMRPKEASPPIQSRVPWSGFHLVDVNRVWSTLVIAFTWDETPGTIYVHLEDVSRFDLALPAFVDVLAANLLENLGEQWWRHYHMFRIGSVALVDFSRRVTED